MSDQTWNTLSSTADKTPVPPQVPESIWSVFWIYGGTFGLFAGIGRFGENLPKPYSDFVSTFGYGVSLFLAVFAIYEWRHIERRWELYKKQEEAKLPKPLSPTPERMEISVTHKTETGSQTKIYNFDKDKLPPADFVNFIFDTAGTDGRVLTERAIGEFKQWQGTGYNDWLSVMDKLEITRKVDERPNSARRLACTREVALQHFNYEIKEHGK